MAKTGHRCGFFRFMGSTAFFEYANSRGTTLKVDRERGIIQGVKILGGRSENNRDYPPDTIRRAIGLYEGAKVNVDHPGRGQERSPRSYHDRIGFLKGVREDGGSLYGDLHYNPKHLLAEQLAWDAENAPHNVGLSHNAHGNVKPTRGGRSVVEEITKVVSVDLVADPATTKSLYESAGERDMADFTIDDVRGNRAVMEQLLEDFRAAEEKTGQAAAKEQEIAALKTQLAEQKQQLDEFRVKQAIADKKAKVDAALAEAKLPAEAVTETFVETLMEAKDDAGIKKLIEDRRAVCKLGGKAGPTSTSQQTLESRGNNQSPVAGDLKAKAEGWAKRLKRAG